MTRYVSRAAFALHLPDLLRPNLYLARMLTVGLIAIGVSGAACQVVGWRIGDHALAADQASTHLSADRCADLAEYYPTKTCAAAEMAHHADEIVSYRIAAGVLGVVALAGYLLLRPLAPRAEELGVDLGAEASGPVRVDGARPELRSLIENLLDNALRYAPRDSAVTLSVRRSTRWAEMRVTDAGPGIPEAERAQVFERFHRVAGDVTPGSGLGLAIAKAIVERHGGEIALEDARPGHTPPGLAVVVRLPAQ